MIILILADHNAYLTLIEAPAVAADPGLNISGSSPTQRWSGRCQAHIEQSVVEAVRTGMPVNVDTITVQLPANLPTYPNTFDLVTFTFPDTTTMTFKVYTVNSVDRQFGKIVLTTRQN